MADSAPTENPTKPGITKKPKSLAMNLAVALASLVIVFLFLEIILRITHPELGVNYYEKSRTRGYTLKSNYRGIADGVLIETNSKGIRDRDYGQKRDDTYRILVLGDSVTMGVGVESENTFARQLEKALNDTPPYPQYPNYEVINAGITGYNTQKEYILLEELGIEYDPDMVLLCYSINDAVPTAVFPVDAVLLGAPEPITVFLRDAYDSSYLLRFLRTRMKLVYLKAKPLDYEALFEKDSPGWQESREYLLAMKSLAEEHDMAFLVIVFPELINLDDRHEYGDIYEQVRSFCEENDIYAGVLFPYFRDRTDSTLWITPTDRHPNEEGHRIVAGAVYEILDLQGFAE